MQIFYTAPVNIQGRIVRLGPEEARHAAAVLRHAVGDHILVVDGEGSEYRCIITHLGRRELLAEVISQTRRVRETIADITLAPSLIKGNRLDAVVEQATELGVSQIQPIVTARTVAGLAQSRLARFDHLAVAAVKSSTRTCLPRIRPAVRFEEFLRESPGFDLRLLAYEEEERVRLPELVSAAPRRIALVIGPEGGFTEAEVVLARERGFRTFRMGPRRLRAETACITALSMLLFHLGEI
jgi:16S rRNA (uracil1498-N3)-methyltransferase